MPPVPLTWRQAIQDAQRDVETAQAELEDVLGHRRHTMQLAYDNGATIRQIAQAAGLSLHAVQAAIGKQYAPRGRRSTLDLDVSQS